VTRWFDVDLPEVIALRRRLYADHDGYRMIGCSVTDPSWSAEIPTDAPVLVIAEGLLMYLAPDDVAMLLQRIASAFPSGRLLADGLAPWVVRLSRLLPPPFDAFGMRWAMRDADEFARLDPSYRAVATTPVLSLFAQVPDRAYRWLYRAANAVPGLRTTMIITAADVGA
jgi:O-methyltransferase involved in polyketide biosynthesis